MRECRINFTNEEGVCIVQLEGALDSYSFPKFERTLGDLREQDINRFILDCADLEYVSSVAIGALLGFTRAARDDGGDLVITNLAPKVQHVIELLGFHRMLDIHENLDSAKEALRA